MAETAIIETEAPPELLTLAMIRMHYVPLGARTLFRMIAAGTFPRADIAIGGKTRFWKRSTVESWIEQNAKCPLIPDSQTAVAGQTGRRWKAPT